MSTSPTGLALGPGLADADDRDKPGAPRRPRLRLHLRVGLAAGMPALGMPDNRVAASGVLQHLGADAAGERARRLRMAILAAERDAAAGERLADRAEQCEGRTDEQVAAMQILGLAGARPLGDLAGQRAPVGAQQVHLPVAGDKPFSFRHLSPPRRRRAAVRRGCGRNGACLFSSTIILARLPRHDHTGIGAGQPTGGAGAREASFFDMMQAIRGRAGSIIVKILFALLILSFGAWGISDYLFRIRGPQETVIAKVGDEPISRPPSCSARWSRPWSACGRSCGTVDMQLVKQLGIVDNVLEQLIDRSLLNQETQRLGLDVPDEVIRNAIYENPAFRGPDGKFDRRLFAQVLMMNRLSEDQLIARMRQELPRNDLLQAVTSGVQPPRPLVEALYRHRNEKRVADIVSVPVSAVAAVAQPSEAELTQFYEEHPDLFRAPEYRGFTLASLSPSDLKPEAEIPEDTLQREYEERKDEFQTPEQREIQQILAPTEEKAKAAEAALAAGKEFREVAAEIGMDPGAIELGLLNRKEIPHELGDIAFELPLNQPSAPIKTPFGYHILRVVKIEPGKEQSFEEAKPQLAAQLQLRQAADRIADIANQADDALAGGAKLEDLPQKFGFKLTPVAAVDENGLDPAGARIALPVAPDEVLKTVFATAQGESTRVTDTQDGALYVARVDQVTPSALRPLAEVRDKAVAAWQAEQKQKEAAKQAEALAAAVTPSDAAGECCRREGADRADRRDSEAHARARAVVPAGARYQAVRGQARRGGLCRRRYRRLCGAAEGRAGAADDPGGRGRETGNAAHRGDATRRCRRVHAGPAPPLPGRYQARRTRSRVLGNCRVNRSEIFGGGFIRVGLARSFLPVVRSRGVTIMPCANRPCG